MEFTLKITADDNLLKAINNLAQALSGFEAKSEKSKVAEINTKFEEALAPTKQPTPEVPKEPEAPKTSSEAPEVQTVTNTNESYSIEDIRALVIEVTNKKSKAAAKEVFSKFGITKVSDVPAEKYADVIAALKAVL